MKSSELAMGEIIDLAEKKCEVEGIRHILKNRLLQVPDGVEDLPLQVDIKKKDIKDLFEQLIRDIVAREVENSS